MQSLHVRYVDVIEENVKCIKLTSDDDDDDYVEERNNIIKNGNISESENEENDSMYESPDETIVEASTPKNKHNNDNENCNLRRSERIKQMKQKYNNEFES